MLDALIELLRPAIQNARIVEDIAQIHSTDRFFTYPKFHETARYTKKRMQKDGLAKNEIITFPADGKTCFGTWRGGLAWDATSATLTLLGSPNTILADYQTIPCSLAMWSAPTPPGGIEAQIIDVGAGTKDSDYAGKSIAGNIAFANARGAEFKALAVKHGAVGMLTDWNPQQNKLTDGVFWNNSFADDPAGWTQKATCSRTFCFGITRRKGQELRQLLAAGKTLRVHADVRTKLYEGDFPVSTAVLPGTTSDEILAIGHAFEQGAKDNASGVACILEAVRVLAALVRAKKLPRPKRSIRILVTNECYGTIGYVDRFPERTQKTAAAICLDETGIDRFTSPEIQALYANPQSTASYIDSFMEHLAQAVWTRPFNPWISRPYGSSDNLIAHSTIGIPAIWMGCHGSRITWHTSTDIPSVMMPAQLGAAALYTATYLYFLANAGPSEAIWLADIAAAKARADMQHEQVAALGRALTAPPSKRAAIMESFLRRLNYLLVVHESSVVGVSRLSNAKAVKDAIGSHIPEMRGYAKKLVESLAGAVGKKANRPWQGVIVSPYDTPFSPAAQTVRPAAIFSGPLSYDPIPLEEREGHVDPRWSGPVNVALGWADGVRTLAQIVALAEHELGRSLPGVAKEFLWLIAKGLIRDAAAKTSPGKKTRPKKPHARTLAACLPA